MSKRSRARRKRYSPIQHRYDVSDLRGECVVCGQVLTEADYDAQRVIAAVGPEGTVVCCVTHCLDPQSDEFRMAAYAMAEAIAKQLEAI